MRIALVSPYSWTYPGGVIRHVEALSHQLESRGHDVTILAPVDHDTPKAARMHRGARPLRRELPGNLVDLGPTVGWPANGGVGNLCVFPTGVARMRRELGAGGFDVVHLHEPIGPALCWTALCTTAAPLVGTFHCYGTSPFSHGIAVAGGIRRRLNRLHVRIAVSEAAAWTGRRWFGGHYRVIPNGVDVPPVLPAKPAGGPLRIVFVGQAVERKGLPVLLRAFEALRDRVDATLTVVGASRAEVAPLMLDDRGVTVLGKVGEEEKSRALAEADVLCAPSLGGESFGMVLTEAFAHGTPVVASNIAGYADVVSDGSNGLLVPRGDAAALAAALRDLGLDAERRRRMGETARADAGRYAWPRVAAEVETAYEDAAALSRPETVAGRAAGRLGLVPADGLPRVRAQRLPSLDPAPPPRSGLAVARRLGIAAAIAAGVVLSVLALQRVGVDNIGRSLVASSPAWVLAALGLMVGSMVLRAVAWRAILRAALPDVRIRHADALQGTAIGVLMSATLPARLGEPSRAFVVARRLGRVRERFPVVLGTMVSQTLLNIAALVLMGIAMFSTVDLFRDHQGLVLVAVAPVAVLLCLLVAPALARGGAAPLRRALVRLRQGLRVFRRPREGAVSALAQLSAWAMQWIACYLLLVALGLDGQAGLAAAAAVLFAVNVTAVVPATPSNLGVFQAACVAVLGAYGVGSADALAYGIILQAVEIATAVIMGAPALVREGLSWREVRLRALHAGPVTLPDEPAEAAARAAA